MTDIDHRVKPSDEIRAMSAGQLVHHMLINFVPLPPNPDEFEVAYYMQNSEYMEAHDALNNLLPKGDS